MASNLPTQPSPIEHDLHPAVPAESALPAMQVPVSDDEEKIDIRRYFAAIFRYKWLVVGMTAAGAVIGYVVAKAQRPTYQAQSTIWVEVSQGASGPLQQAQLVQNQNWIDLLQSFTVMDSVVKERRLYVWVNDPSDSAVISTLDLREMFIPGSYELKISPDGRRYTISPQGGAVIEPGNVGDSIGRTIGLKWLPPAGSLRPGRTIGFGLTTPRQAALDVVQRLDARYPMRDGNFIRMTLQDRNPIRAAATLNSIGEQFVHVAAELKAEKLRQLSLILGEQLNSAETQLHQAERSLELFRVNTITEPSDAAPPVQSGLQSTQSQALSNFFSMKTEADNIRRDRESIERVLASGDSGITSVALEGIGAVQANADLSTALKDLTGKEAALRALRARYTDNNPQVIRADQEIRTIQRENIPSLLRALLAEMRSREQQLGDRIAMTERDLRQIPTRTIEEARLRRDVDIANNLYITLQERYSAAKLAEASSIPDVRILDPAVVPDQPIKNLKLPIFIGAIAAGFGLSIGLALLLDHFDRRLRYPDQVAGMGLTVLGAVPRVKSDGSGLRGDDAAQVVEALRSIRLNLVHAYGAAGPLITTVTSPGSGDGKSFLASNLALAFADAGHRTLLIDADIRRGTLHRVLNASRKPGLLDYLSGQATREQVVQSTRVASVDFIGCGTRKIGGPELLASPAMSQLLIGLRSQYSVIILDSAPLGAGVDPLVLGSLTGSILLVLRTGVTDRELASAKLGDLDRLPIRILGAVLNDVKPEGVYRYYSYIPGYSSEDEAEEPGAPPARLPVGKA